MVAGFELFGVELSPIGAAIGLVIGGYIDAKFTPEFHGTGQPHDPHTKEMLTWESGYLQWLSSKVFSWIGGSLSVAYAVPKIQPIILNEFRNSTDLELAIWIGILLYVGFVLYRWRHS